MNKGLRRRCSKRPVYKRRRRVALLVLLLLIVLVVVGLRVGVTGGERLDRINTPVIGQAPEIVDEQTVGEGEAAEKETAGEENTEEEAAEEEEPVVVVPNDPTLFLTVPRLSLFEHTVRNDDSEQALDLGAIKIPGTDFPWQKGDKNTYIACHRLGWPGTESYNQCLNLPSIQQGDEILLKDVNGTLYEYRVSETLVVGPNDSWVTKPVTGKDVVSLQTCIEAPGDFLTLGPNWSARFVVRAERA
jgi:sortase A